MAEVVWFRRSLLDLRDIAAYIALDDPRAADRMSQRLQDAGNALNTLPKRGRPYGHDVRVLTTVQPYLIFYEVRNDTVNILTIRHSRRRPPTP